jgi:hypothetical protein
LSRQKKMLPVILWQGWKTLEEAREEGQEV